MKKLLIFLFVLVSGLASAQSVNYFTGPYDQLLDSAKRSGKPIMLDFYTSWCVPCKVMDEETFTLPQVYNELNENFLSMKINCEYFEGMDLAEKYHVGAYPSFVFLNANGETKGTYIGSMSSTEFIQVLERKGIALASTSQAARKENAKKKRK